MPTTFGRRLLPRSWVILLTDSTNDRMTEKTTDHITPPALASAVSAKCFYQLRQLRRVRRSLDADSAKILVHALVTSRIDYCNGLLANAPSIWTDKLQRVFNAAACVITNTRKFDRELTNILQDHIHWLDLPRRVLFKICVMVYKSLHGMAPKYLAELCRPISDVQGRRHLRSAHT